MNALRWISLVLWVVLLVVWVTWYVKGRERLRLWKAFGVLLLGFFLEHLADFYPDTAIGWTLRSLSFVAMVWCFVLMVREVRVTWREQMERVKHL